ncbi:MAG TPA: head GIN domain-containing protein [Chitinophagaceae bacterium]|nr:head GIN domain-containing protein [Chitinophagaceae bacterium]
MKKKIWLVLLAAMYIAPAFTQKTITDANAEKRIVESFHGIDVATGITLILTRGEEEEVAVSAAAAEFRDKIITRVTNGILRIHYETKLGAINKKNESKNLKAYVSYKSLNLLHVNTGAEVEIQGILTAPRLELEANTGGLVNGEVDIDNLKVSQNTGSKITLTGKTNSMEIYGDTGSKFIGESLTADTCSISVSTGAGVTITVENELNAKANTGGYIKYKGDAGIREIKTNTGGSISKI